MRRRARGPLGGRPGRRERPSKDCEHMMLVTAGAKLARVTTWRQLPQVRLGVEARNNRRRMWRRARGPLRGRPGRRERPTKDCEQLYQRKDKFEVPCVCDITSLMFVFWLFVFVIFWILKICDSRHVIICCISLQGRNNKRNDMSTVKEFNRPQPHFYNLYVDSST